MSLLFPDVQVLIRGGGDLASGVAYRLRVAGFPVFVTELAAPLMLRRGASYGAVVFENSLTIDGLTALLARDVDEARQIVAAGDVSVLVDPGDDVLQALRPAVLLDARMAKVNLGTTLGDAPLVVALGPGFTAPLDCHAVIETNRGHSLGRVIRDGQTEPDTRTPGNVAGRKAERVLRAPDDGFVEAEAAIGDILDEGALVARVGGSELRAPFRGVLRGIVHASVRVTAGLKIGDLDPRLNPDFCFTISDKALAIGGGALEAVFASQVLRERLAL